jgi:hypothetical protein
MRCWLKIYSWRANGLLRRGYHVADGSQAQCLRVGQHHIPDPRHDVDDGVHSCDERNNDRCLRCLRMYEQLREGGHDDLHVPVSPYRLTFSSRAVCTAQSMNGVVVSAS